MIHKIKKILLDLKNIFMSNFENLINNIKKKAF